MMREFMLVNREGHGHPRKKMGAAISRHGNEAKCPRDFQPKALRPLRGCQTLHSAKEVIPAADGRNPFAPLCSSWNFRGPSGTKSCTTVFFMEFWGGLVGGAFPGQAYKERPVARPD